MDNIQSFGVNKYAIRITFFLLALGFFFGTSMQAQQGPRLSATYAKVARSSLLAIQSDTSTPQDEDSETIEIATTQTIDAAAKRVVTKEEESITETLRQIYQAKRHDNATLRAYRILMEIENAEDDSDDLRARKAKDYAVSQFADAQAAIMEHEDPCFRQLEQSLDHRLPGDMTACSEWIQKSARSTKTQ